MEPTRSEYREYRPPTALGGAVVCLWTQTIEGARDGVHRQGVLPDGCVDIVWLGDAAPIVAGPATRRAVVGLPAGTTLVGVRFRPGWAAALLGVPTTALRDRDAPLSEFWGKQADIVTDALRRGGSSAARRCALADALARRVAATPPPDPAIEHAVRWTAHHPAGRIRDLARTLDLDDRQLRRRFADAVGYGPKTFQRIMRLQRVLMAAGEGPGRPPLAQLATDVGFADQAHMCRELAALAGASPSALLAGADSTLRLSDLFNTRPGERASLTT